MAGELVVTGERSKLVARSARLHPLLRRAEALLYRRMRVESACTRLRWIVFGEILLTQPAHGGNEGRSVGSHLQRVAIRSPLVRTRHAFRRGRTKRQLPRPSEAALEAPPGRRAAEANTGSAPSEREVRGKKARERQACHRGPRRPDILVHVVARARGRGSLRSRHPNIRRAACRTGEFSAYFPSRRVPRSPSSFDRSGSTCTRP